MKKEEKKVLYILYFI